MMERENRRNSILKPATGNLTGLTTAFECEEEQTENFTISRRKSFKKRVSFAGRDEIKEFQKHEVLTVRKLEKALTSFQDEVLCAKVENFNTDWDSEKENVQKLTKQPCGSFSQCCEASEDMEVTTMAIVDNDYTILQNNIVQEVEMEVSTLSSVCNQNLTETDENHREHNILSCYSTVALVEESFLKNPILQKPLLCETMALSTPVTENTHSSVLQDCKTVEIEENNIKVEDENLKCFSTLISSSYKTPNGALEICTAAAEKKIPLAEVDAVCLSDMGVQASTIVPSQHFLDEVHQLLQKFQWKPRFTENELTLSKTSDYLTFRLKLDYQYVYHCIKHYIIDEIEFDIQKDQILNKWAKFGILVLENTLESCNLKGVCSSTQDLQKFLNIVEEHNRAFLDFLIEDSLNFELLVNPRSVKLDTDFLKLTFESSNLENLFWVRITLTLSSFFPLVAKEVVIDNILGTVNKTELINMISTIRPSCHYLTRVAECIDDFLKFRPTSKERKVLDLSQHSKA